MLPNAGRRPGAAGNDHRRHIGVHPRALLDYAQQDAPPSARSTNDGRLRRSGQFYVDRLAEGIATITAAFAPNPVIVRLSDFKSNEYANLIGGKRYEPHEENPMIGFRGASRYVDPSSSATASRSNAAR
jgi:pyruvate,water dikinase